jgi:hypothetical protein
VPDLSSPFPPLTTSSTAFLNLFLAFPLSGAKGDTAFLLATTPKFIISTPGCLYFKEGRSGGNGDGGGVGRVCVGEARKFRKVSLYRMIGVDEVEGRWNAWIAVSWWRDLK